MPVLQLTRSEYLFLDMCASLSDHYRLRDVPHRRKLGPMSALPGIVNSARIPPSLATKGNISEAFSDLFFAVTKGTSLVQTRVFVTRPFGPLLLTRTTE
ncbi:hypothetical protein NPIL_654281 [Nephila pilipes]|uniref:Uncharacterized protein n=1 Tax=Nephila pilipes TaxID=299642 RepID=A0A8X6NDK4_NEPPI|nr:hypothetical protein NPIL_654281 [Nephila pilipes]